MVTHHKLYKKQKEVLDLIVKGFTSINLMANELKTTPANIYKHIKKLEEKGYLEGWKKKGLMKPYPPSLRKHNKSLKLSKFIRLHGCQFSVSPYYPNPIRPTDKYDQVRRRGNRLTIKGWVIRLFPQSIDIYSGEQQDWRGETVERVTRLMEYDFNRLLAKLESRLSIGIVKDEKHNIRLVNSHYAEVNSELPEAMREVDKSNRIKLTIYGKDGLAWFKIDESWKMDEAECIHPRISKEDAQKIFEKYLNDLREHNPPTNSELATHLKGVMLCLNQEIESQKQIIEAQTVYNANIVKHLGVLDEMSGAMKNIRDLVKQTQPSQLYQKLINSIRSFEDYALYKGLVNRLPLPEKQQLEQHILKNLINN